MTPTDSPAVAARSIDREALRRRDRAERDKRLRPDGNAQYVQASGVFARYFDNPYTPIEPRAARTDHVIFAFVGGGFAGLVTAARLIEARPRPRLPGDRVDEGGRGGVGDPVADGHGPHDRRRRL